MTTTGARARDYRPIVEELNTLEAEARETDVALKEILEKIGT